MNATLMGLTFMSLFVANGLVGSIGGFYEKMSPATFWAMHAAISAARASWSCSPGAASTPCFNRNSGRRRPP